MACACLRAASIILRATPRRLLQAHQHPAAIYSHLRRIQYERNRRDHAIMGLPERRNTDVAQEGGRFLRDALAEDSSYPIQRNIHCSHDGDFCSIVQLHLQRLVHRLICSHPWKQTPDAHSGCRVMVSFASIHECTNLARNSSGWWRIWDIPLSSPLSTPQTDDCQ
eukprot:scaffold2779_cov376-Prasinococcus_capsulatus_cf.AAC.7